MKENQNQDQNECVMCGQRLTVKAYSPPQTDHSIPLCATHRKIVHQCVVGPLVQHLDDKYSIGIIEDEILGSMEQADRHRVEIESLLWVAARMGVSDEKVRETIDRMVAKGTISRKEDGTYVIPYATP